MRVRSGAKVVEVVFCPDNFYPRGSFFLATEFFGAENHSTTIDDGYWIPGMVIATVPGPQGETEDKARYRVVGEMGEPQELVEVEQEACVE